jgi:hypothetical protein
MTRVGETLSAMLHFEKSGDRTFQASADAAVPSQLGGAIEGIFEISDSAPQGGRVP